MTTLTRPVTQMTKEGVPRRPKVTISLPLYLVEKLDEHAVEQDMSRSAVIVAALRDYFAARPDAA